MKTLFITSMSCMVLGIVTVLAAMIYVLYYIAGPVKEPEPVQLLWSSFIPAIIGLGLMFIHEYLYNNRERAIKN